MAQGIMHISRRWMPILVSLKQCVVFWFKNSLGKYVLLWICISLTSPLTRFYFFFFFFGLCGSRKLKTHTTSTCLKQQYFPPKCLILLLPFCNNLCSLLWDWRRPPPSSGWTTREMGCVMQDDRLGNYSGSFWAQYVSVLEPLSQLHHHNLCNWRQQPFKHHTRFSFPLPVCGGAFLAIMLCFLQMCDDCYNRKVTFFQNG